MKYRVEIGPFAFGQGFVLGMTDEQAASRMHLLQKEGDGYTVTDKPVEFKTGEIVEVISGDVGRAGKDRLVNLDADRIAEEARRQSEDETARAIEAARLAGRADAEAEALAAAEKPKQHPKTPDKDFDDAGHKPAAHAPTHRK